MNNGAKQVVSMRLAGFELASLDQLASLNEQSRSETVRSAIVDAMRLEMLEHPDWPMHPAWTGEQVGVQRQDLWIVSLFQHWAAAVVSPNPAVHFEQVTLDGVTRYRLKAGRPILKIDAWEKNLARYLESQEATR